MLDIPEKENNMSESSSVLIQEIRKNGIPAFWMDTRKMQDAYSLEIKGSLISDFFWFFRPKMAHFFCDCF